MDGSKSKSGMNAPRMFRTPGCAQLYDIYTSLQARDHRLVPNRKALDLKAVPSIAPYFGIFQIKKPDTVTVRLVGTGFVLRTGIENTGQNMLEFMPENLREWTYNHFHRLLSTPCGAVCVSREVYGDVQVLTEVISLPFADSQDATNLIVSASIPFERPDYQPEASGMEVGGFYDVNYFDIGAGTGTNAGAAASSAL